MTARIADEREQRRGLILGLTLAESLLLLLFLLMLAMASQIKHWRGAAVEAQLGLKQLQPLQDALLVGGAVDITSVQKLVLRFHQLTDLEKQAAALKQQNEALLQQSELLRSLGLESRDKQRDLTIAVQKAAQINPSDPPALLKRAIEVLDRIGPNTQPDQVKPLSQMMGESDISQKFATLEADREKIRRERDNLMRRNGNGLTYPSCWTTPTGQTEYMFDVTFMDSGVRVKDATVGRARDAAWAMVGTFPRNTEISEQTFVTATKKLFNWATEQNCKFYTINRDATGAANKVRYKFLQRTVEQNFYPYYPPSPQQSNAKPANSTPPSASGSAPAEPAPEPAASLWNPFHN